MTARMCQKHVQISHFLYMLPVAQFYSDNSAICYLFLVSCFHIMEGMGQNQTTLFFVQFTRWQLQSDIRQHCLVEFIGLRSLSSLTATCLKCCIIVRVIFHKLDQSAQVV